MTEEYTKYMRTPKWKIQSNPLVGIIEDEIYSIIESEYNINDRLMKLGKKYSLTENQLKFHIQKVYEDRPERMDRDGRPIDLKILPNQGLTPVSTGQGQPPVNQDKPQVVPNTSTGSKNNSGTWKPVNDGMGELNMDGFRGVPSKKGQTPVNQDKPQVAPKVQPQRQQQKSGIRYKSPTFSKRDFADLRASVSNLKSATSDMASSSGQARSAMDKMSSSFKKMKGI